MYYTQDIKEVKMYGKNTIINSETAIKPYYYVRNGLLHVRYNVDRAIKLSETEEKNIKEAIALEPYNKQDIFARFWSFFEKTVGKTLILDGIEEGYSTMKQKTKKVLYGRKN